MIKNCIVLIDNRKGENSVNGLKSEHGLSIYFEWNDKKWLLDTGASSKFIQNAESLGIDIRDIDYLVISHGHNDHGGGLRSFLTQNDHARVFLSDRIPQSKCFTCRKVEKREIGLNNKIFEEFSSRFHFLSSDYNPESDLSLFFISKNKYPKPLANHTLFYQKEGKQEIKDDFSHEIAICMHTKKGLIILSACTHNGLFNTIESCQDKFADVPIIRFIGGMHLVDGDFENQEQIIEIAHRVKSRYPDLSIVTGHCTSDQAISILRNELGEKFKSFHTGMRLCSDI